MPSTVTTFGIFQALLNKAVNADATLDSGTRASMLTRISELARAKHLLLDQAAVETTQGNVTSVPATNSVEVAIGVVGTNRVQWKASQFLVPVDIDGTFGEAGFLVGHGGQSANPLVAIADISLVYRLSATDVWRPFTRSTLLREVSWIQFAADIADQTIASAFPQVSLVLNQV